jgi:hypothetical protein
MKPSPATSNTELANAELIQLARAARELPLCEPKMGAFFKAAMSKMPRMVCVIVPKERLFLAQLQQDTNKTTLRPSP